MLNARHPLLGWEWYLSLDNHRMSDSDLYHHHHVSHWQTLCYVERWFSISTNLIFKPEVFQNLLIISVLFATSSSTASLLEWMRHTPSHPLTPHCSTYTQHISSLPFPFSFLASLAKYHSSIFFSFLPSCGWYPNHHCCLSLHYSESNSSRRYCSIRIEMHNVLDEPSESSNVFRTPNQKAHVNTSHP